MTATLQIKRTSTPDNPPIGLLPGELSVEMDSPTRLWVGVPVELDPTGKKQLNNSYSKAESDAINAAQNADIASRVLRAGDTMTGFLTLSADPTSPLHAVTRQFLNSFAPLASPALTGTPTAPTAGAGTSTTQVATTQFVTAAITAAGVSAPSNAAPAMDGVAAAGVSALYSRGDHVHPTDTTRASLASPTFTGVPAVPTAAPGTNTTQVASTAFVAAAVTAGVGGFYVLKTGDTMTGNLTIDNASTAYTILDKGVSGTSSYIQGKMNGLERWTLQLGNNVAESTGNVGSNFSIDRHNDAGTYIDSPVLINRATGAVTVNASSLSVIGPSPYIAISTTSAGGGFVLSKGGLSQWSVEQTAPSTVADFTVNRFNDAGTYINTPFKIERANGVMHVPKTVFMDGVVTGGGGTFLVMQKDVGLSAVIESMIGGNVRWAITLGDGTAEGGGNTGSAFAIGRYSDAGAYLNSPIVIPRDTGVVYVSGLRSSAAIYQDAPAGVSAYVVLTDQGSDRVYLQWDRAIGRYTMSFGGFILAMNTSGQVSAGAGIFCKPGLSGAYTANCHNFNWTTVIEAWIDNSKIGNISMVSDYRVKKDVAELPSMWDTVKALRPIKYTHKDFSPPSHIQYVAEQLAKEDERVKNEPAAVRNIIDTGPLIKGSDDEHWGFIAHELQETMIPTAASGIKDAENELQSPNQFALIAALTKALQEAMTRIEALEARP